MTWNAHQGVTDMDVRDILYLFFLTGNTVREAPTVKILLKPSEKKEER
jgi:hypothetical protein